MSKRADKTAARADDDASPSGNGEPPSTLEPSEAFKRPRLASDARKPIQTRAREPRPLIWRDTAEESDAPPLAPRRRQPRAASPPPEASEAPTPEFNSRTLDDPAAVLPSPPPPAPAAAPAAPPAAEATPTDAAAGAMARGKSAS